MQQVNTLVIVVVGVFLLWLAATGRIKNVSAAWKVLIA